MKQRFVDEVEESIMVVLAHEQFEIQGGLDVCLLFAKVDLLGAKMKSRFTRIRLGSSLIT